MASATDWQIPVDDVIETLGGESDDIRREFFDLMMSCYKMELKGPKEYRKEELNSFEAPLLIIASGKDIFFRQTEFSNVLKKSLKGQ